MRPGSPDTGWGPSCVEAASAIALHARSDNVALQLRREARLIRIAGSRFFKGANVMAPRTVLYLNIEVGGDDAGLLEALTPAPAALDVLRAQPSGVALAQATAEGVADGPGGAIGFAASVAACLQEPYLLQPDGAVVRHGGDAPRLEILLPADDQRVAAAAWNTALDLARWLHRGADAKGVGPVAALHEEFIRVARSVSPDMLSIAMARAARRLDIPVYLPLLADARLQLGQGVTRRLAFETMLEPHGHFGHRLSQNKYAAARRLASLGVPVLPSGVVASEDEAVAAATRIGGAVVVKPLASGKGRGVSVGLRSEAEIREAYGRAAAVRRQVMVEAFAEGDDHRLLVVGGKMIAAARRIAAHVTGDGESTVARLIEMLNADPARGDAYEKLLERVSVGPALTAQLARQSLSLESVPAQGAIVWLTRAANISKGGTAVDVTDLVHPDNQAAVERAAEGIGLGVAGIDFISPDISRSWREAGGWVLELNVPPGLRPHWIANPGQDVVTPIVRWAFPEGTPSRIPTAGVTGSMGKTTTCQMLARITTEAGLRTGLCTTQGIWSGDYRVAAGDSSGGGTALRLLSDPTVEAGVFELARGGMLKHGMVIDGVDVAAVLNVHGNHVGIDGIETRAQLAAVKAVLASSARRWVFLNAEDELVLAMRTRVRGARIGLVALDPLHPEIAAHRRAGGCTVTLEEGVIRVADGASLVFELPAAAIPAALGGRARAVVANAMFAAGMAYGLGLPAAAAVRALSSFVSDPAQNPGRHNRIGGLPFGVVLQWLDGEIAMRDLIETLAGEDVTGKRALLLSAPGSRSDDWLRALGRAAAGFDRYYFKDFYELRGRRPGEIGEVIAEGLREAGVPDSALVRGADKQTITAMMEDARPGDLLVAVAYESLEALDEIERFRRRAR